MDKDCIRQKIKLKKAAMRSSEIETYSEQLTKIVLQLESFQNADCIFAYHSFNQEVHTFSLIEAALKLGKKVALPVIHRDQMEFHYITSLENVLIEGKLGVLEPQRALPCADEDQDPVWMLMPGLAFDKTGGRIGYGKAYYDRYLSKYSERSFYKVALCYDFQLVERIELEAHDQRVDRLISAPDFGIIL